MGALLPPYPDHWAVCVEKQPTIEYSSQNPLKNVQSFLWYNMQPEIIPETFTEYFEEKLAISDKDEALNLIAQWNKTVSQEPEGLELKIIFPVDYAMLGIADDPVNDERCLVLATYGVRAPGYIRLHAGRGGYAWQYLDKEQLTADEGTHHMVAERFALWDKEDQKEFIMRWNKSFQC